ncbi:hypothetical protein ACH5RR_001515 [Cinchona calisaya]|uniref:MULE transposase domain-containing protein n=1 Tax=Cinchona calisaya TaxID=153742 RepID=A0ABD3B3X2_9GENT
MSKMHYESSGDVMVFDTIYRTNKYNMICAPFVGVNNHWKNVYFGCAFLHNENASSFEWLFTSFLDSMSGKAPNTIFTDQDAAIATAIKKVFPNSCHSLCKEYTRTIFFKFQDEFLQGVLEKDVEASTDGTYTYYTVQRGWLCRHTLGVMHVNLDLNSIPRCYVLRRWTKWAKHDHPVERHDSHKNNTLSSSLTVRLSNLMRDSFSLMRMAIGDDASEQIVRRYLSRARFEVSRHQNNVFSNESSVLQYTCDNERSNLPCNNLVLNPKSRRQKEKENLRLKSCVENRKTKKRRQEAHIANGNENYHEVVDQINYHNLYHGNANHPFSQLLTQVQRDGSEVIYAQK